METMQHHIMKPENQVYKKSSLLTETVFSYCPGCGHSTANRVIAEVIEEMGIQEEMIGVSSVGCSAFIYDFIDIDWVSASHGRACAVATGIKRVQPDKYVFTYQGDGDLAAIGTAESMHTCNRGDKVTIFFVNNATYGMTGGQMAPTTIAGMKTSTSPYGREVETMGHPIQFTDLVSRMDGVYYATRQSVNNPASVRKFKKSVRKAFESQHKGTSIVEIVSSCNSSWKLSPVKANEWMEEHMFPVYPMGDIKVDGVLVK